MLVDAVLEREDPWIRRRLVLSSILTAANGDLLQVEEYAALSRLLGALGSYDLDYLLPASTWLTGRNQSGVLNILPKAVRRELNLETTTQYVSEQSRQSSGHASVRSALEWLSLDMDLNKISCGDYGSGDPITASRGRYSKIEDATSVVMENACGSRLALATELIRSYDEGIRWSVASQLPTITGWRPLQNEHVGLVSKLLADPHPWVVREVLSSMERIGLSIEGEAWASIAEQLEGAATRPQKQGWPSTEVVPAVAKLLGTSPGLASRMKFVAVEGRE